MKYKISLLVFFTLLQFSCEQLSGPDSSGSSYLPLPALTIQWNEQNSIVCFGTSLTYGYGAGEKQRDEPVWTGGHPDTNNTGDSSYPRFLQERLKIKVYNKGFVGARTNYALSILTDSVISKKPALILLEFGANDFLWNIPSRTTDSLLNLLVARIKQTGTQIVMLSFIHPDMVQYRHTGNWSSEDSALALEYSSMINQVAVRNSVLLVDFPLKGVFGNVLLMSDALHPNGEGYKTMATNVYSALIRTFEQNGMVK